MGLDAMILVFWMLSFKPTFSLSSFTFIKRLFSFSSLSAIRVVSSAYLRLLLFLLAILIPAYASSSPAFLMMYSAYKLNKQGDNVQPWCTPFPLWNPSVVPCTVLTVASWPAYRCLKRRWTQGVTDWFYREADPDMEINIQEIYKWVISGSKLPEGASLCQGRSWSWLPFLKNWDVVALQYCASFCCTMKWISCLYTFIPSLSTSHSTDLGYPLSSLCQTTASH